jgi:hypothetical protein
MISYNEIADVLESVARYIDDVESQKTASLNEAKAVRVNKLAESYEAATGEKFDTDLQNKLASLDPEVLDHLLKVAHNNRNGNPESLGGPADVPDAPVPQTIKEAAVQAEDKFLTWILA